MPSSQTFRHICQTSQDCGRNSEFHHIYYNSIPCQTIARGHGEITAKLDPSLIGLLFIIYSIFIAVFGPAPQDIMNISLFCWCCQSDSVESFMQVYKQQPRTQRYCQRLCRCLLPGTAVLAKLLGKMQPTFNLDLNISESISIIYLSHHRDMFYL